MTASVGKERKTSSFEGMRKRRSEKVLWSTQKEVN